MSINSSHSVGHDSLKVQIADNIYNSDEVFAYFDDILDFLNNQKKSIKNKTSYIKVAKILLFKKEYRKSLGVIYQALSKYPDDPSITKVIVEVFLDREDTDNAEKVVEEYLAEHSNDISFRLLKAKIKKVKGEEKEEEQALLEVIIIPRYDFISNKIKDITYRRLGELYMQSERFEQAEGVAEELLKRTKEESIWSMYFTALHKQEKEEKLAKARDDFARFKRARLYFDKGYEYEMNYKFNLARINYGKGLQIYPNDAEINVRTGNILMHRKKWYSKAEEYLLKAVEIDPDQANYRSSLALCFKKQGKYKEAYKETLEAARMDPESNIYLLRKLSKKLGKMDEFSSFLTELVNDDEKNEYPGLRYEMALFQEERKNTEEAVNWFKQAAEGYIQKVKSQPDDWGAYLDLGDCYNKLQDYDSAEKAYLNAEEIKGCELIDVYERLVDIYQKTNRPDKSSPYLRLLVKKNPGKIVNYIDLGINFLSRITSSMRKKDYKDKKEKP